MRGFISLLFLFVFKIVLAQQIDIVDFERIRADLRFKDNNEVSGSVSVSFEILKEVDSIYLDAAKMEFSDLKLINLNSGNLEAGTFKVDVDKIGVLNDFKRNTKYELQFRYAVKPKKALYFIDDQIWTQGQGKYTSSWLPSIDDTNDKIEFDLAVTYKTGYEVLANGHLVAKDTVGQDLTTWRYTMDQPMSSYLVALAIGKYSKKVARSESGIPMEYYFYPEDSAKVEPTYRYSKQMFDFLEKEIGVPYPWGVYKQVPVKDFLYSGMENTSLTIFSDALVVDAIGFNDRNYVNVNAHELAHQWFGDLVTAKSGEHHWLQEGFATYYALLTEREVFGEEYYYWRLYEYAQQLLNQEHSGEATSLLDPKSSSVTFYQKGCWALHLLREQVGDAAFRLAVKNYLLKHQFKNVETSDFIREVEEASNRDLSEFVTLWLEDRVLPQDAMVQSLKKSDFIQEYLVVSCETYPTKCNDYLVSDISDKAKIKIVLHPDYEVKLEDFSNALEVRQSIAQKLTSIPIDFKSTYETLLNDASYVTIESALYNLWVNFPADRARYLHQTKDIYGFNDYNVKLLWLVLHLNTLEYQPDKKQTIFEELRGYTDPKFSFDLRMNAFNYLKLIQGFDDVSLAHLIQAKDHHNWRFQRFAKQLLAELEDGGAYRSIFDKLED